MATMLNVHSQTPWQQPLKVLVVGGLIAVLQHGMCGVTTAQTHSQCLEVISVQPSREIRHDVQLKDQFDSEGVVTDLIGPKLFSHQVGIGAAASTEVATYLNWYAISRPLPEGTRNVTVQDQLHGRDARQITIGKPAYLLSPAQRVTTGAPSEIPDSLNYFKAYAIVRGETATREIALKGALGPPKRRIVKAAYLCVPVEHWHHDDHSAIKRQDDCFVVYELEPEKVNQAFGTLDQFGLNQLKAVASGWLCVPARLVNDDS